MRLKHLLLCAILCSSAGFLQAQTTYPNKEFTDPNTFVPKTPEASGLFQFSEFSVDHSSGAVNTNIPLFTAQSGRIKLPVSLNYNANGIKVQQLASSIGLGWNLDFGYSISVTEEEPKQLNESGRVYKEAFAALDATNLNTNWMREMKYTADGYYRTFWPLYRFKCGDISGMFYYDEHDPSVSEQLKLVSWASKSKLKIEKLQSGAVLNGFKITTIQGLEYTFDKKETSLRVAQSPALGPVTTNFFCTKVRDVLNNDEITFEYTQRPTYTTYSENSLLRYTSPNNTLPAGSVQWEPENKIFNVTRFDVSSWIINRINWKDGYANFEVANDRLDIDPTRIKSVTIYSKPKGNFQVSKVSFTQSYFQTSGGSLSKYDYRLRLDEVVFNGVQYPDYIPERSYAFTYNYIALPAYRSVVNSREQNPNSVDYWGFYTGRTGGMSFLSSDIINSLATISPIPYPYSTWG